MLQMNDAFYDGIAEGYDELYMEEQLRKLATISERLRVSEGTTLLDVGCGSGISTRFFRCRRTGIDPSEKLLAIARREDPEGSYLKGCVENLPFPDSSFDVVMSVTAAGNFSAVEEGISEIHRVARGRVVISFLKRSPKRRAIEAAILRHFAVEHTDEEEKDCIYFLEKR